MNTSVATPIATARLVCVSVASLCSCCRCSQMTGFYRIAVEIPTRSAADMAAAARLQKNFLFGKEICAN